MMRAKLTVDKVTKYDGQDSEFILFSAKYDSKESPEDNSYSKYTPAAHLAMTISNPDLLGKIKEGDKFYLDFTKIEK